MSEFYEWIKAKYFPNRMCIKVKDKSDNQILIVSAVEFRNTIDKKKFNFLLNPKRFHDFVFTELSMNSKQKIYII